MARRLVVFGPVAQAVVVVALLAAAVAFALLDMRFEAGVLVAAIVSRMLPVASGRPNDSVKVVTRGLVKHQRAPTSPAPLSPTENPHGRDEVTKP